ncbi:MAG: sulfatase-like hydrolase/transferase, partial [Verrucomicrobiota bacterium]|nr:sulfatase-like hydrolase/transferase [Verrucomicrobiota bacterium]
TPNILLIVADDLGYADAGFNGCKDIPTPNLDRLARQSVRCTNGYVSHPFCSPTRAGLLTGRYQQRFGHENNPKWAPEDDKIGLPVSQTTLAQVLKSAGYVTGCIGKWHLGAHPVFHPNKRGFDHYFGLLGGGHIYLPGGRGGVEYNIPLDRNGRPEPLREYLTDALGREAAAFVAQHRSAPWFLTLAFNAPHTPLQVTSQLAERVKHIHDETRRGYAGLVVGMDDALGVTLNALRESGQEQNTLIFFFSDNGGPTGVTHSDNAPLRGAKGSLFEGGIRVPFLVSWPARLEKGRDYDQPVSSLDVFATAAELAGAKVPESHQLDGVNLIPFLTGVKKGAPHPNLFWRTGGGATWAVREHQDKHQWKLVNAGAENPELFDLSKDRGETNDVSGQYPGAVARLQSAYDAWNKDNIAPLFEGPRAGQPPRNPRGPAKVETK